MGRVTKPARAKRRVSLKKARAKAMLSLFVLMGTAMTGNTAAANEKKQHDFDHINDPDPVVVPFEQRDDEAGARLREMADALRNDEGKTLNEVANDVLEEYRAEIRAHEHFDDFKDFINRINPNLVMALPQGTTIEDLVDVLRIDLDKWDEDIANPVAANDDERRALAGKRFLGDGPSRALFEKLFNKDGDNTLFVEMDNYVTGTSNMLVNRGGPVLAKVNSGAFLRDCFEATSGLYGPLKDRLKAAIVMFSATAESSSIWAGYMPMSRALNGYSSTFGVSFDGGKTIDRYQLVVSPAFKGVHRSQLIAHMSRMNDPNQHIARQMNDGDLTGARAIDIFANFHEIAHAHDVNTNGSYRPVGDDVRNGDISHFEDKNGNRLETASQVRHRHEVYADIFAAYHIIKKYGEAGIRLVEMQADIRAGASAFAAINDDPDKLGEAGHMSPFIAYHNHEALSEIAALARAEMDAGKQPFADMDNADIADQSITRANAHTKDIAHYKAVIEAFQEVGIKMMAANVDERLEILDAHIKTLDEGSVAHKALSFYKQAIDNLTVQADELEDGQDPRSAAMDDWVTGYEEAVATLGNRDVAMQVFRAMITEEFKSLVSKAVMDAIANGEEPNRDDIQAYVEENVKAVDGDARLALEERVAAIQAAHALGRALDEMDNNIHRFNDAARKDAPRKDPEEPIAAPKTSASDNKEKPARKTAKRSKAPSWRLG